MEKCYRHTSQGIELFVRLTPGSSQNKISGFYDDEHHTYLRVNVTSVPEDGKANKALLLFLSKTLKIPKTKIRILSGHAFRNKVLLLEGIDEEKIGGIF